MTTLPSIGPVNNCCPPTSATGAPASGAQAAAAQQTQPTEPQPDTVAFSSGKNNAPQGTKAPIGILTGALACCALPFFALGAMVALAGVAAIKRGFTTAKGLAAIPSAFQTRVG